MVVTSNKDLISFIFDAKKRFFQTKDNRSFEGGSKSYSGARPKTYFNTQDKGVSNNQRLASDLQVSIV